MQENPTFYSIASLLLAIGAVTYPAHGEIWSAGIDPDTGLSAVVVIENQAIAHTAQLLPWEDNGDISAATLDQQLARLVANIDTVLREAGSNLPALARLNLYVRSDTAIVECETLLKRYLGPTCHPALTIIAAQPSDPRALVSGDAIAAVADASAPETVLRLPCKSLPTMDGTAHVAVLPKGRALYISGMAEQNTEDLAQASRGTMDQLHGVLALNGLSAEHVVHVKAFMKPAGSVASARKAIAEHYPGAIAPPMTFVDWQNATPATEIEMIAWVPGSGADTAPVVHLWPAEVTPSPVYCRYAIAGSPTRIYTKGFTANASADAASQVHDIFAQLKEVLEPLGSDFRHMVKATYYVTAEDTSTALNQIRPEYYDPKHPPAASKATIAGVGRPGRGLVLDMIAVPK